MKKVKNTSMQGFYVLFQTPEGPVQKFMAAKAVITVPDSWGGKVVDNLLKRRMLKVTTVADAPIPAPISAPKPTYKTTKKSK